MRADGVARALQLHYLGGVGELLELGASDVPARCSVPCSVDEENCGLFGRVGHGAAFSDVDLAVGGGCLWNLLRERSREERDVQLGVHLCKSGGMWIRNV